MEVAHPNTSSAGVDPKDQREPLLGMISGAGALGLLGRGRAWRDTPFLRYTVALLSVEFGILARIKLNPIFGSEAPHATFFIAVIISAVLGGWQSGLLALVLGEIATNCFVRGGQYLPSTSGQWIATGTFLVVGLVTTAIVEAQQAAQRRANAALARLQQEVKERRLVEGERCQLLLDLADERIRFGTVLQQSPIGVVIAESPSGKALFGNAEAARILRRPSPAGLRPGEPNERWRAFHGDGRPYEPSEWPLARAISRGEVVKDEEMRIEFTDGVRTYVSVNAAPVEDCEQRVSAAIMTLQDITDRKAAASALTESEERYRSLFERSLDPIFTTDLRGRFVTANPAAMELSGYSLGELKQLFLTALCAEERAEEAMRHFLEALRGETQPFETVMVTRTGQKVDLFITGGPLVVRGTVVGLFVIATDITRMKRAQARLGAFSLLGQGLNSVQTPLDAARIIGEITEDLFGWDAFSLSLCELDGPGFERVLQVDTIDGKKCEVAPRIEKEVPPRMVGLLKGEAELILKTEPFEPLPGCIPFGDASRPSASLMFAPIRDHGNGLGVLTIQSYQTQAYDEADLKTLQSLADYCGGALRRIRMEAALAQSNERNRRLFQEVSRQKQQLEEQVAERRQIEQQIQRLNTDLEHVVQRRTQELVVANEELEAFCYSVSHDLRAPLRSIAGFSQALVEDCGDSLPPHGKQSLQLVVESTREMDQLIDDLLGLSRLSRADLVRQSVDLSALAEEIAGPLQRRDPKRMVEWLIAPNLAACADGRLMRIALENLLGNAWKFTGKCQHARIEFGVEKRSGEAVYVVRDNGAGFDMNYAEKLFHAFQRLHSMAEFPGHGIGLATVQRIIHRHGGRVWAESEVDRGATFYFSLPAQ